MGKDKTVKSVGVFEQLSQNKFAISDYTQSASKLQTISPVVRTVRVSATIEQRHKVKSSMRI